jgi:hypothetical protein
LTLHLYSYNENSEGCRELAAALGIKRIRHGDNSRYIPRNGKTIINWGTSDEHFPQHLKVSRVLNHPSVVSVVTNKLKFFRLTEGTNVNVPTWTDNKTTAAEWFINNPNIEVVCRTVLNGHSGQGIQIVTNPDDLYRLVPRDCSLFTRYTPKRFEYRVHFAFGDIIDLQRKIKDPERDVVDFHVRSHNNGFIFARNGVEDVVQEDVKTQALNTIAMCGLDFGAIDIIYNEKRGEAYVLEVNTAPGLTGETINSYANAFRDFV